MINAIFRAGLARANGPDRTGNFMHGKVSTGLPQGFWIDLPRKRRAGRGLGTSTAIVPRIPVSQPKINNKIKMFAGADKHFLTIFNEDSGANECCGPRQ